VEAILRMLKNIPQDSWVHSVFTEQDLKTDVLRLDKIHPEISGNKWFKLKYYLECARNSNIKKLISFGGAYSNHLLALSYAARMSGLSSVGLVRGEKPAKWSPVLLDAQQNGMEICFLPRTLYDEHKQSAILKTSGGFEKDVLLIPEGGAGPEGVRGAEEVLANIPLSRYTHIICAVGTGTTLAGIINGAEKHQKIIGISVLKGTQDLAPMNTGWLKNPADSANVRVIHEDHFGGYAKYTPDLIDFMNQVYADSGIPTDFVYTGKLFYSVVRMAANNAFAPGSRLLVLHTGGLSGNRSLPAGLLQF
jgi:1-aminocyclopropane-1-carboxylate deaminase